MRILMLDNEFPPLGGGTGVVNYHFLAEIARLPDIWVDLVTSSRTRDRYEVEDFSDRIRIYKVPVDNANIHHSTNIELVRYMARGFLKCRELIAADPYDVCFTFAGVPAGFMGYLLSFFYPLPYIVSLQGPDVPGFEARYNYLYPVLRPILRRVWGRAAVVTAISQDHQALARQTMPDLPIPIIANGVDTRVFSPAPGTAEKDAFTILCVGRLIERKGQHHLLQALAELQDAVEIPLKLVLVGTGDFEPELRRMTAALGLQAQVEFTGFVDRAAMPAILQQGDLFVLPSQNEGMSIALLEAMAAGLPVVVTETGGTEELVVDGLNGRVVRWADVAELTTALAELIQAPADRVKMGAASRKVAERYNWESFTQKNLALCRHILENGTGQAEVPHKIQA